MKRIYLFVVLIVISVDQCFCMSRNELEDFKDFLQKTSQLDQILKKGTDIDDDEDEEETVSDHAWEDSGKFEGDLILNDQQRRIIVKNVAEGLSRNGLKDTTKRWPNNEVVYFIQGEHFNRDQIQAIQQGIDDLAQASCVKFRPYQRGDRDAVVIQGSRRGCFSQVGFQGGYQILNLSGRHPAGRGCFRHGTVVHELLHTLGFYHMQSSPDRDDYINVVWENILQPARHNFRKYNSFAVSDFGVGYDYDSVLHYSRRAFSSNGQDTLVPKQRGAEIGQRIGLSDKDTKKLNRMYCDADSNNPITLEDDTVQKPIKKKSDKNKPFDGHGIGYHQGKTVVIKILPTPETYKLQDFPSFHMFDYFSKGPQALSQTEVERSGKEINPVTSYDTPRYLLDSKVNNNDDDGDATSRRQDHAKDSFTLTQSREGKNVKENPDYSFIDKENEDFSSDHNVDDFIKNFDRVEKNVNDHVYPSHSTNLKRFKLKEDSDDLKVIRNDSPLLRSADSVALKKQGELMKSTVDFIDGLFEKRQNYGKLEALYKPEEEDYGTVIKTPNTNNMKKVDTLDGNQRNSAIITPLFLHKNNGLYHSHKSYSPYAQNAPKINGQTKKPYVSNNQLTHTDEVKGLHPELYSSSDYKADNFHILPKAISHVGGFTGASYPYKNTWHNYDDVHDSHDKYSISDDAFGAIDKKIYVTNVI